jgi:single-strand DNA-binding protein
MSHTVVAKLNKPAREFANANGVTFFVGLGEKNYDFKLKTNAYTNYDAALFAKDGQIDFYRSALVEGAIISVSGTGLIIDVSNAQYPKLMIQDAKLGFINSPEGQAPQQAPKQQQAPQQAPQQVPQMAPAYQQVPQQAQLTPDEKNWLTAVKATPSLINDILDPAMRAKIQALI